MQSVVRSEGMYIINKHKISTVCTVAIPSFLFHQFAMKKNKGSAFLRKEDAE